MLAPWKNPRQGPAQNAARCRCGRGLDEEPQGDAGCRYGRPYGRHVRVAIRATQRPLRPRSRGLCQKIEHQMHAMMISTSYDVMMHGQIKGFRLLRL